jgi:hypothetical protein
MNTLVSDSETRGEAELTVLAPVFLRRADAANYLQQKYGLRCAKQTLAKFAVLGGGPVFRNAGRVPLYAPKDLDEWALSRVGKPRKSTSTLVDAATA